MFYILFQKLFFIFILHRDLINVSIKHYNDAHWYIFPYRSCNVTVYTPVSRLRTAKLLRTVCKDHRHLYNYNKITIKDRIKSLLKMALKINSASLFDRPSRIYPTNIIVSILHASCKIYSFIDYSHLNNSPHSRYFLLIFVGGR